MDDMLSEAAASPLAQPQPQAAPAAQAVNMPGVCMGVAVFMSLGMAKIGFTPLTEKEAETLTASLVRNLEAWEVNFGNPKIAAAVDLSGTLVAILVPRIMSDVAKRNAEKAQAHHHTEDVATAA